MDHVSAATWCSALSWKKIYIGDKFRNSFRAAQSIIWIPGVSYSYNPTQQTGATRNYAAGSPVAGDAGNLSAYPTTSDIYNGPWAGNDEDGIADDCLKWNHAGQASTAGMFPITLTVGPGGIADAHFAGQASNPLESQLALIKWNLDVVINASNPASVTAYVTGQHTCYPAHSIKVNGTVVYDSQRDIGSPSHNSVAYIGPCLTIAPQLSVSTPPVAVSLQ